MIHVISSQMWLRVWDEITESCQCDIADRVQEEILSAIQVAIPPSRHEAVHNQIWDDLIWY